MVIQTGSVLSAVSWKRSAAGSDLVQLPHQLDHIFYSPCACIGAKIPVFIFFHPAGKQYPGIGLLDCYLDKGIAFIILQHGIILWPVLLDQVTFQYKGLQLRVCDDIFKSCNMGDHLLNFCAFVPAALEILAHPVFEADGLAHINNLIPLIMHQVYARLGGKLF